MEVVVVVVIKVLLLESISPLGSRIAAFLASETFASEAYL